MEELRKPLFSNEDKEKKSNVVFCVVVAVLMALMVLFVVLNTYVYINIQVDGESMMNTLSSGDLLVANKTVDAKEGDIVVIAHQKDYWLIKRVIAVGDADGTTVKIENGGVYVDGEKLDEPYAKGITKPVTLEYEWTIFDGEIFYLGDNRENSADARSNGPCLKTDVVGVIENWSVKNRNLMKAIYFIPMQIGKIFGSNCSGNVN